MTWPDLPSRRRGDKPFFWYDGPSNAGPWIIWQQPHPIAFAEMAYRAATEHSNPAKEGDAVLQRYNQTVHDTADFMAAFILQAPRTSPSDPGGCFSLGPPMYTAEIESDEGRPAVAAKDGTFELVYWRFGLHLASQWRQ